MVAIHNVFIRGLNAIHNQAVKVGTQGTEEDKTDFFEFAAIWAFGLHEHHALEETKIFPDIEEVTGVKGVMEANVHQHEAFTEGITQYQEYLKSVRSGAEVYDGHKLLAIIDSFGPTLAEHLLDEIETLKSLRQYSDADFELVQKRLEKYIQDNVQKGDDMVSPSLVCSLPWDQANKWSFRAAIDEMVLLRSVEPRQAVREGRAQDVPADSVVHQADVELVVRPVVQASVEVLELHPVRQAAGATTCLMIGEFGEMLHGEFVWRRDAVEYDGM